LVAERTVELYEGRFRIAVLAAEVINLQQSPAHRRRSIAR